MLNITENKIDLDFLREIQKKAEELGFELFGATKPNLNKEDYENLKSFIEKKQYANMEWFSNYIEIRLQPSKILEDTKTVFVFGHVYKNKDNDDLIKNNKIKISRYATGKDYHKILKKKLKKIDTFIKNKIPDIQTRITVDSAPVPEKILAKYAGLGWQGKNTNIIHPLYGSYFFIACIFLNYEITEDWSPTIITDGCKNCQLCIISCPTNALEPYKLNVERCLSYRNIESKEVMPIEYIKNSKGWVFGCDICQEVCPYNNKKFIKQYETKESEFKPREEIKQILNRMPNKDQWEQLKNSPLKRVSYEIFINNYKNIINYV